MSNSNLVFHQLTIYLHRSVDMAESKNEMLRGQIDEGTHCLCCRLHSNIVISSLCIAQAKILSIESVVEKGESRNQVLRTQFSTLLQDIENLKVQEQTYRTQMESILAYELGPHVVFNPNKSSE
jgi:hypothetical protein